MFEDLIESIKQDPEIGTIAKERAQKILEHSKIFACQGEEKGIKRGPGRSVIPVSDLWGLTNYLVNALSYLEPGVVEVDHTHELWIKHDKVCEDLMEFFILAQQLGMIAGGYDPDAPWETWPGKIVKIFRQVGDLYKIIKYPAKSDQKTAKEQLIIAFLIYAPKTTNNLIAEKILILLEDIAELPKGELPRYNTLRQQAGDLRKKGVSQSYFLTFPKGKEN